MGLEDMVEYNAKSFLTIKDWPRIIQNTLPILCKMKQGIISKSFLSELTKEVIFFYIEVRSSLKKSITHSETEKSYLLQKEPPGI